jgi:uncharacterized alkaline shock family protein YloU
MDGDALISHDVLARYAADAALEVTGVSALVDGHLPGRRGVRIDESDGGISLELHVAVSWGASIPEVGARVQRHVGEYLARMADVRPTAVDVVVDEVAER